MSDSDAASLGSRLRERRLARGLTLTQAAAEAEVSKGFLSQLENGRTRVSVATLTRLASAVGSTAAELLAQPTGVVTAENAPSVHFGGTNATDRLLTPAGLPGFQVLQAEVQAGGRSDYGTVTRPETHFIHVLSGSLTVSVNGIQHVVNPGENLSFTTPGEYGWSNPTRTPTTLLWVVSPPPLA